MMTYFLNIIVPLTLIIFQTTIFDCFGPLERYFDVVIVYIVFLGFSRNFAESFVFVLLSGMMMDGLAGGPFGVYLTTYFWIFVLAVRIKRFLHAGSLILLPIFIVSGVLFENFVFLASLILRSHKAYAFPVFISSLWTQLLWALFLGPLIFLLVRRLYAGMDHWVYKIPGMKNRSALRKTGIE